MFIKVNSLRSNAITVDALCVFFCIFLNCSIAKAETAAKDNPQPQLSSNLIIDEQPIAFAASYLGLTLTQNQPISFGLHTWSKGGPAWGAEYRFFYKDTWSLSISGSFKQLQDYESQDQSLFSLSQETLRLIRIYHPWYFAIGGRLSYLVPVRRISIPYERDQSRAIDNGAALSVASFWIIRPNVTLMLGANRWRSLSTTKRQGIEILATSLIAIR